MGGAERVHEKIQSFRRKYYLNIFLKGAILTLSIVLTYFVLAALLEHILWLDSVGRFIILLAFLILAGYCLYRFLKEPLRFYLMKKGMTEEQSARLIGDYVPGVKDRLLNLVQLLYPTYAENALSTASIQQKSREFEAVQFETFIDLKYNRRYLKLLFIPVFIIVLLLAYNINILTGSAERIVNFSRKYSPAAPFTFHVEEDKLTAIRNEDFLLQMKLTGEALPEKVYLLIGSQRLQMEKAGLADFSYLFTRVQENFTFQFEAAGYYSPTFRVEAVERPQLNGIMLDLSFPSYLGRRDESLQNAGNLEIPEGTQVKWKFSTISTTEAVLQFKSDNDPISLKSNGSDEFTYEKSFKNPDEYELQLVNDNTRNKEKIAYSIQVVKDVYPSIVVDRYGDSLFYKSLILAGSIADDYGLTRLHLNYEVIENENVLRTQTIRIPIAKGIQQNFFYSWNIDSLRLKPGQKLQYYLKVWDNDGVNGSKASKTGFYTFLLPSKEALNEDISNNQIQTQNKLDQASGKAEKLQQQINQAYQKLKGKQSLDWQDKKMLEDILQQKESLDKLMEELKKQNKVLEEKKETFTEQDERIKEKAEQLQKLMEELLDEETKKLFDELQKLLKDKTDVNELNRLLEKLNQDSQNLEKELERTLELFKRIQMEFKLDQAIKKLDEQIEHQDQILQKTESLEKENSPSKTQQSENQDLAKEQQQLSEEFSQTKEELKELDELNKELNESNDIPGEEKSEEVESEMKQSQELLEKNQPGKSKAPQQKSIQQMKQMKQQLESAQNEMNMEMDMQNIESLRHILHGLVKLSFDQESLMKKFGELNQSDPQFNTLAQQQIKIRDDAKVLEDSLLALGKRDPFMESIVSREVGELNSSLNKVIEANKERKRPQASSAMQLSMTSINNLALMLDDHFEMMMQMMANASSGGKNKKKGQQPSLGELQQQLNRRIEQLKGSGKSGRELSEELAKLAAEQERIRKALKEMEEKMKDGQLPGGDLPSKMEQTEMDLVNKQLSDQLIKRQKDILTRLLEAEKSMREQDLDEERKGETAKEYENVLPKAFEDYLKSKEREVELLKTLPPKLYPYYKKEVNEYFKRIGTN